MRRSSRYFTDASYLTRFLVPSGPCGDTMGLSTQEAPSSYYTRTLDATIFTKCKRRSRTKNDHGKTQARDARRTASGRIPDPDGALAISSGQGDRGAGAADWADRGGGTRHYGGG